MTSAKEAARARIEAARDELIDLSHKIHANPELGFEEVKASGWAADALEAAGLQVERGVCDLPTAFVARAGSGPLHVGICAEYDALPSVGHACGHNIICAAAVGAGIGLAGVADEAGLTVSVLGTPFEEGGGGKIIMLNGGAFDGVHVSMMVHPAPLDILDMKIIAAAQVDVRYTGKEAHAAAFPEEGVNAADALTVAQVAIGLLRQHIRSTDRVHGYTTKGGVAPNVIPAETTAHYMARAATLDDLVSLKEKVERCFEAGAVATGATLDLKWRGRDFAEMQHDLEIAEVYRRNSEAIGRPFPDLGPLKERLMASTDMGNISLAMPSIHPMIGIGSFPATNHQPEFTAACATEEADRAVMDGAVAMAWTAIDLAADDAIRPRLLAHPFGS